MRILLLECLITMGWTKIGFTERDVETRIKEQTHTVGVKAKIWWHLRAMYMSEPFGGFTDKDFHAYLKKLQVPRESGTEWFRISPAEAKRDFIDFTIMVPFVKTNFGTIIMCHYLPYMYHIFFYAAVSKLSPKTSAGVLYPNASCGL
jgi:hypothetical protein